MLFSKKAKKQGMEVTLKQSVRRRLYYLIDSLDPLCDPRIYKDETMLAMVSAKLLSEHGWEELKRFNDNKEWVKAENLEEFMVCGLSIYVFDVVELFYELYYDHLKSIWNSNLEKQIYDFHTEINRILSEADLPWRLIEGSFIKVDSKWIENEIMEKTYELIKAYQFEGALLELQEARSDLLSGDTKDSIIKSAKAFESVCKIILEKPNAQPRELLLGIKNSGLIPDYYDGFLKSFHDNILNSVIKIRNHERGVSHGQGATESEPPESLAQLALHLSGVLIYYILQRYQEQNPSSDLNIDSESNKGISSEVYDIPF